MSIPIIDSLAALYESEILHTYLELEHESLEILTACAKLNCARQNYKTCSVLLQHIHRLQPENQWVRAQMKLIGL